MVHKIVLSLAIGAALVVSLAGCTENDAGGAARPSPPPLSSEPIGVQLARAEPTLAGVPFRVLVDFERPSDLAFLSPAPRAAQVTGDRSHTGRSALRLNGATDNFAVKLPALLGGQFPGKWTIAGAYFAATGQSATRVTVAYHQNGSAAALLSRTVEVRPADGWAPVLLDLTPLAKDPAAPGLLTFESAGAATVYCDDIVVIDNARTLDAPLAAASDSADVGWTIRQAGFAIVVERPNRFRVELKTPEASADGWRVIEACDLRARFVSVSGKTWTIYADGRQYRDGVFSTLVNLGPAATALLADQHANPAEPTVPAALGRIDRDTPGDRNNDAYNEQRGCYELIAKGPRFEVTLTPTRPLLHPVLEIANLPPGPILATVEGQLIERSTRLPNGTLLIELPLSIERATTLNITVK